MAYWNTRGLRGSAFEEMVVLTNRLYLQKNLAVVQKIPTPITPIEVDNAAHRISVAYFEKKSTVDFLGVAGGLAIAFDAKETREKSLPLKNIHAHQVEFMEAFEKQGGAAFLLVHFAGKGEIFLLPAAELARWHGESLKGGRKSVPYSAFTYRVENCGGFPVHYLPIIQKISRAPSDAAVT